MAMSLDEDAVDEPWSVSFDTIRREKLFRNPPEDKSAFPALIEAGQPHVESFNALFGEGGLLDLALQDIGERTIYDGAEGLANPLGNKLICWYL